jgi:serine phosphatase RsbU (regulator of sigma subunit)
MAKWLALLFESVKAFAGGTTQEDDMTAVVVKREA